MVKLLTLVVVGALLIVLWFAVNYTPTHTLCFYPPADVSGSSYENDPLTMRGNHYNIRCKVFLEEDSKAYFNASRDGVCMYSEIINLDLMHGGVTVSGKSGNPESTPATLCFDWAVTHVPAATSFIEYWDQMREY